MGLKISGRFAEFVDPAGQIIAFDPSLREPGYNVLLIKKDALEAFLKREKLVLFWTLLGEKNIYPPSVHDERWLGRLTLLGLYSWQGGPIKGGFRTEFFKGRGLQ